MIVTVQQAVFEDRLTGLHFIFAANLMQHALLTDPVWDEQDSTQPLTRWARCWGTAVGGLNAGGLLEEALRDTLEYGASELAAAGSRTPMVSVVSNELTRWEDGVLSPADGLRLMLTPLWLVLENGRNDFQFLRAVLDPATRRRLDWALADGVVDVPLGGGTGELKHFLTALATAPLSVSGSAVTRDWIRRLRSWVMFDHDADPNDRTQPSRQSQELKGLCLGMAKPFRYPGNQLGRRTIENYLPFESLHGWVQQSRRAQRAPRRRLLDLFKSQRFGAQRRACFAMKDGLKKDLQSDDARARWKRGNVQAGDFDQLFRDPAVLAELLALRIGFGSEVAGQFASADPRWIEGVFDCDPAAQRWREGVIESLRGVL